MKPWRAEDVKTKDAVSVREVPYREIVDFRYDVDDSCVTGSTIGTRYVPERS